MPTSQRHLLFRFSLKCLVFAISAGLLIHDGSLSSATLAVGANKPQDVTALSPGANIERKIAGNAHTYSLALVAGDFVQFVVEGRDIDPILLLRDSQGKTLVEASNAINFSNQKRLSFVCAQLGDYQLTVRPRANSGQGSYQLSVGEWRRAEPKDESTVAAERLLAEGQILFWQGTAESRRQAIQKYEESLPLWRAAMDIRGEAEALSQLSEVYHYLSENQKALERGEQALMLWRTAGNRWGEAATLNVVGFVRWSLNDYRKALEDFNQALSLRRAAGYRRGEADLLHSIGIIYSTIGESQKALDQHNQSLSLWREIGDSEGIARTLNSIGTVYTSLGEYQKALEGYDQALPLRRATGNRRDECYTLSNIADAYDALGEYLRALEYYEQALLLSRSLGDRLFEANTLNHIGSVASSLGDHQKALEHYHRALALSREVRERRIEANALGNMGLVYQKLGEYQKASDYHRRAFSIRREIGDRLGEAVSLSNLGFISSALGDTETALEHYGQALVLWRAVKSRKEEAMTLFGIARVERDRGNLREAVGLMEAALEIIESLRTKVSGQELRASFLASVRELYDLQIDLLARLDQRQPLAGHAAAALVTSERSRARSLLETLAEARADIRQGVAPELLERQHSLQLQINSKAERLTRLLSGKPTKEEAQSAQKELDSILSSYHQLEAQIRTTNPRYAALTQPQPLTFKEIQQQVVDPDTLLLEYSLGEERSYLWAVSPTSITSFSLPKRAEIEGAARRLHRLLTAGNQQTSEETPAQYHMRVTKSDAEYMQAATDLSRMLLAPVAAQLGTKRLLIVGEGALQYVPFGALPVPAQLPTEFGSLSKKQRSVQPAIGYQQPAIPLLLEHEIVTAPSASVLSVLRREFAGRQPAPKSVAVLADPVFRNDDPRINRGQTRDYPALTSQSTARRGELAAASDIERSARESGLDDFLRLRFTRQEAEAIAEFAPEQNRLTALDFVASRETAQSAELGRYRVVHFATHGLLNSKRPELSGIVFSLVDERGRAQDGFLRLHQIYNLKLNADLVVLSACQTALGKEVRGEGLIGLTRGFMYAGSPRVVSSLWRVDDRATAELMKRFYSGMLKDGLRPAAALRASQVSMLKEKRWSSPHYWAAFTLQGEWR
jgi:CHAT domain-containing protein/Tfp pilus assembly protein PilF